MKKVLVLVLFAWSAAHTEILYNPEYTATKKNQNESIPNQQSPRSSSSALTIRSYPITSSTVEVDEDVIRSALRYRYDPEYRTSKVLVFILISFIMTTLRFLINVEK